MSTPRSAAGRGDWARSPPDLRRDFFKRESREGRPTTDQGGYGKPPKGRRWEKGESGNKAGRPPKPIPTWAEVIENEWKKSVTFATGGQTAALELILLHLWDKLKDGDRRAARVLRKYQTVFKRKLLLAYEYDNGQSIAPDGRHKRYKRGPDTPLSEKEKKYRHGKASSIMPIQGAFS